jgi:hypothetical protein
MLMKSLFLLAAFTYAKSCWTEQIHEQIIESRESIKAWRCQLAETSCMWREQTEQRIQDLTTRINKQISDISATKEQLKVGLTAAMEAMGRVTQFEINANDVLVEQKKHREKLAAGEQAAKELVQLDQDIVSAEEKCATKLLEAKARQEELMAVAAHDEDNYMVSGHRRRGAAIVKREGESAMEVVEEDADTAVAVVEEPCPKLMMKHRLQGFAAGSLIMALIILFIVPMFGAKDDTPAPAPAPAATDTDAAEVIAADATADAAAADATAGAAAAAAAAADPTNSTVEPEVVSCTLGGPECTSGTACIDDTSGTACIDESVSCSCSVRRRRLSQRKLSSRRWR